MSTRFVTASVTPCRLRYGSKEKHITNLPIYRLFRTLPLEGRLTSLVFSPEGAALYGGTEDGQVLVLDLRALDKPPKCISTNSDNEPIICMAVQVSPTQQACKLSS